MVHWRKSSHSGGVNDEACVEVARLAAGLTGVRDSKHPGAGDLRLTGAQFAGLLAQIKSGDLDR
ncbi:DUF397 domain-containing protein [Actinomadura scrupuli]|uniref:DUF397 domain-containing protein n=1 Tax=Actinomadura scrupuli TaxID=559629 RepID=UPI003D97A004